MNIILVGINAKYIHSNLAIRYLQAYAKAHFNINSHIAEYTINQRLEFILKEIYLQKPDVVAFSCYIWNYEYVKLLCAELRKILPRTVIVLGGPEVSYNPKQVIAECNCSYVISGEGEKPFAELMHAIINEQSAAQIDGVTLYSGCDVITNSTAAPIPMDDIDFVYSDLSQLENRIIYYEASRGCPFSCQYCLSCSTNGVRFLSLERVFKDMQFFLDNNVRQVKFVDRTFNCNKKFAMDIWKYLIANDNNTTNFHFEIAAELIDDEIISLLKSARKGLFQFEIGIQSTNPKTLEAVKRKNEFNTLKKVITTLQAGDNIHLHLDLIAGLPFEDYNSFAASFNYVYSLTPDQLQLGFLKLLKGSGLYEKREEYKLIHTDYAPYEILSTHCLSYDDVLKLKSIEEMVEIYYNSARFSQSIKRLCALFNSPFEMFESLSVFYEQNDYHTRAHTKSDFYQIIRDFYIERNKNANTDFDLACTYDMYSHEKAKNLPHWVNSTLTDHYRKQIYDFFDCHENIIRYIPQYQSLDTKQILRQCHIHVFPQNPINGKQDITALLFNYKSSNLLGNAVITDISKNIIY